MTGASVLFGRGADIEAKPESAWWEALRAHLPSARQRFDALPGLQRDVRRAAVLLLARSGRPVPPGAIAAEVGTPLDDVRVALSDLEGRLLFLVRDAAGDVGWAFPVAGVATPHHLAFASGERLYGA